MANSPHSATGSTVPCSLATVKDTLRCSAATHFWLASLLSRKLHPNSSGSALALQIHQVKQQDLSPRPFLCKTGALRDCEQSCIFPLSIVMRPICLDTQGLHEAPHHSFQLLLSKSSQT